MSGKKLEMVGGAFRTWERSDISGGDRATLKDYLEARGFAVYRDESTELLRETALADFDGEASA